ncbi:hypothetical protein GCM10023169_32010 [Georgenia halophila]|uniref:Uncharacterized protein n=1 Tax=Georgenia halophila TaxID=620889 RepID=A0ABP8LJK6_9MICO
MSTDRLLLEYRYRRLVRTFPPSYRAAKGEEIVSALMDGADRGQQRPRVRDSANILAAAAGRWSRDLLRSPADARADTGGVLVWILPFLLLYPATKAVVHAVLTAVYGGSFPAEQVLVTIVWGLWAFGLAALVLNRRRAALTVLGSSAVAMAVVLASLVAYGSSLDLIQEAGWFVCQLVSLRSIAARQDEPTRGWRLLASGVGTVAMTASLVSITVWYKDNLSLLWSVGGLLLVVIAVSLLRGRYRYAVPPVAAVVAAIWVGRFGVGTAPSRSHLMHTAFPELILPFVIAPLAVYLGAAVLASVGREDGPWVRARS